MVSSKRKLFCFCKPNLEQCSICRGVPGSLPLPPNAEILEKAELLTKHLNCTVNPELVFYRKHYNYVDLPNGYQRTQHPTLPYAKDGFLKLITKDFTVSLMSLYLEEDPAAIEKFSVNYKRAGNALLELVTTPCFTGTSKEIGVLVTEYLRTLHTLCTDLGITNSSKSLKTDVNISLQGGKFRYEIKNLTSIADIRKSIFLAGPLLEQEKDSNKTFHFKNKLIFSRLKLPYLYLKDYNLRPINTSSPSESPPRITFYQLYSKIYHKYPLPITYSFCKSIMPIISKDISKLEEFLNINPKEWIRQSKLKKTFVLEDYVLEHLKLHPISNIDYTNKTDNFKSFIRGLKFSLVQKEIPFNSLTINTVLENILSTDL